MKGDMTESALTFSRCSVCKNMCVHMYLSLCVQSHPPPSMPASSVHPLSHRNPQEELGTLCTMLGSKSCPLQNLSLADSRLKDHMIPLLEAFLTNRTVVELDVR